MRGKKKAEERARRRVGGSGAMFKQTDRQITERFMYRDIPNRQPYSPTDR